MTTAAADGRYDQDLLPVHDYVSVSVTEDVLPVDLAVAAANTALSRSGVVPADVVLSVHATSTDGGSGDLVPASYVQGKALGGNAFAVDVRQTCNGAIAALQLSAAYLTAAGAGSTALITTADRHALPEVDRYAGDPGSVDGDGATAVVLSRGGGPVRLLSTVVLGDGRFGDPGALDPANFPTRGAFLREQRTLLLPMLESMAALEKDSVARALEDSGTAGSDIARWVFPNIGANMVDQSFRKEFGIDDARTTWSWGRTVGHLGTGNQFGGMTHLLETGAVRPGDRIALCGNGLGFSYGCAVLEVTAEPAWALHAS